MPHLQAGAYDSISSRRSHVSIDSRLNQSIEHIKPLKADRSLIKTTGNNIMGNSGIIKGSQSALNRINYGIIKDAAKTQKDPYADMTIKAMIQTTAKPQYDGTCVSYPVPDNRAHLYRIHGQID
mmetsp:Transcript_21590/g.25364  ORF Transcript_21590/g.25364 Transcript_21590/m.25364 type:complete len:124 (+) Transcript_21590:182-553(+)